MKIWHKGFAVVLSLFFASVMAGCAPHDTSLGTKIDDTAITTKVKAALLGDPDVKGTQVSVETVGGTVQLSGFVSSQAEANRAVDLARRVDGVRSVQNKMSIRK